MRSLVITAQDKHYLLLHLSPCICHRVKAVAMVTTSPDLILPEHISDWLRSLFSRRRGKEDLQAPPTEQKRHLNQLTDVRKDDLLSKYLFTEIEYQLQDK